MEVVVATDKIMATFESLSGGFLKWKKEKKKKNKRRVAMGEVGFG